MTPLHPKVTDLFGNGWAIGHIHYVIAQNEGVKAVFDLGNVLVSAHTHWQGALTASHLAYTATPMAEMALYDLPAYLPYEAGKVSEEDYLTAVMQEFGLQSTEEARHLHRSIVGPEFSGIHEIVAGLQSQGIETATLSNNNPIHWEWFTKSGPYPTVQMIQHLIASFHLGEHKPDAAIFAAFCARTGWLPSEIVFVDDSAKNVEAARAMGWTAHVIDPTLDVVPQLRHAFGLHV